MGRLNLWRVVEYDWEWEDTVGIFSTHELAEDAIARRKRSADASHDFRIEHFLLDHEGEQDR